MLADFVGFDQAKSIVTQMVSVLRAEEFALPRLGGMVLAQPVLSAVDSPSVTCSKKDGYALNSGDATGGPLKVVGRITAGHTPDFELAAGQAARITTGAALPPGADAVLADEFAGIDGDLLTCQASVEPGRNVLPKGSDVAQGEVAVPAGRRITPARMGLLAAAGCESAQAYTQPKVALLATGSELVQPGEPLGPGGVYASNLATQAAWLKAHGLEVETKVCPDSRVKIAAAAAELLESSDALITSGGAWLSERDLVVGVLTDLGLDLGFRRVRMGPGKGVAFGTIAHRPVFCLPGSPPSNEMAFLQLALPALLMQAGHQGPGLPLMRARMTKQLRGQDDWTQFWHGLLEPGDEMPYFKPLDWVDRMQATSCSQALFALAEGKELARAGETVWVQRLDLAFERSLGQSK